MEKVEKRGGVGRNQGRKPKIQGSFVKMNLEVRDVYVEKLKGGYKKGILDEALKLYFGKESTELE